MSAENILKVPFSKPSISEEEEKAVIEVIRSGWLTTGKVTLEFEKEFSEGLMSIDYTYRTLESTKEEFLNKVFSKRGKQPSSFLTRVVKYSTPIVLGTQKDDCISMQEQN